MSKCQYEKIYTLKIAKFPIATLDVQYLEHADSEDNSEDRDSLFLFRKKIQKGKEDG